MKLLTKFFAVVLAICVFSSNAQAQRTLSSNADVGQFFKFFCSNIKLRPGDLSAFKAALDKIRNGLPKFDGDLQIIKWKINPPSQCLDGIFNPGTLPSFPGGDITSCFAGLLNYKPQINLPQIDTACIARMMPTLGSLPTFDRNKFNNTLSCLGNTFQITDLDLPDITKSLSSILSGIKDLAASLLNVLPKFDKTIGSPAFASSIRWTNTFCGKVNNRQIDLGKLSQYSRYAGLR